MDLFQGLNQKQKEAVLSVDGPLLILAGAGAGKTKTITHRILYLIAEKGVRPEEILAITFTNKAAREMRDRVEALLRSHNITKSHGMMPFVSTFHSLGVSIIKDNAQLLGLPKFFSIFDKGDGKRAVKEAMEKSNVNSLVMEPGKIQGVISKEKGKMKTASIYAESVGNEYFPRIVSSVWNEYEKILAREKALDFDDLILVSTKLLKENKEVREKYQNRFSYVHIDEYQDTNTVQYQMSRLITGDKKNICVVGDIDQNIYTWRGANIQNILNFEKDYPNAKIILLEENYRSTQTILSAANQIIAKNEIRKEKNLFTKNEEGERITVYQSYDESDEASFIASECKKLIENGVDAKEIAVLYRANFQSRALEEIFLALNVSYQLLGTRFFERKEVKDTLSYLRYAFNPESLSDLARVLNTPPRGIGKVTLAKIFEGKEEELSEVMKRKMQDFRELIAEIKSAGETLKPSNAIKLVIQKSGLEDYLKKDTAEGEERLENLRELVSLATKYDNLALGQGMEKLLEEASLASDQDSLTEEKTGVKLMTVHSAKGLEFEYVFICGLEQDLFPHKKLDEESVTREEAEEERRLFYVALTRAKKKVYLTHASIRTIFGGKNVCIPSEFITDIDEGLINEIGAEREKGRVKTIYLD
ncbi:MAG: UvrD-helicase domain-containing protein [Candidatus Pacebacteria bacterium]|nr:UvrD-helicase domain-containing protein [Candidatus Paceibacterota bacterium]